MAVEDALRSFAADELVVALAPEQKASWLEKQSVRKGFERFGIPLHYLVASANTISHQDRR